MIKVVKLTIIAVAINYPVMSHTHSPLSVLAGARLRAPTTVYEQKKTFIQGEVPEINSEEPFGNAALAAGTIGFCTGASFALSVPFVHSVLDVSDSSYPKLAYIFGPLNFLRKAWNLECKVRNELTEEISTHSTKTAKNVALIASVTTFAGVSLYLDTIPNTLGYIASLLHH